MQNLSALSQHPEVSTAIKLAIQRSAGARFYKCALQVNPFAYYQRHPKKHSGEKFISEDDYNAAIISAALYNNIDVIAITDHFRVDTIIRLQDCAKKAGIITFPGFEANSSDGVHLLCIFPPETTITELNMTIGACGVQDLTAQSPQANQDCYSLINTISNRGGICIAAHACSANGILKQLSGQSRIRAWLNDNLLAVALPGSRQDSPQSHKDILLNKDPQHRRQHPVAVVNTSDVSLPSDFADPSCASYIKMFEPTIEGLRQAFLDSASRIRLNSDEEPMVSAEISAISWDGGFLADQGVRFNNGLNVLVGGRGAGKSAIIESIRYAFDYQIRGPEAKRTNAEIIKKVLSAGTRVSVLIQDAPPSSKSYLVERVVPNRPTVRGEDGILIPDLAPVALVPGLEIFGQHELSELTRRPDELARIVRRFMDSSKDHTARQQEILRRLEDSRTAIESAETEVTRLQQDTSALPGLSLSLSKMDALNLQSKLEGKINFSKDAEAINEIADSNNSIRQEIISLQSKISSCKPSDRPSIQEAADTAIAIYKDVAAKLEEAKSILDEGAFKIASLASDHSKKQSSIDAEYAAVIRQLKSEGINAEAYIALKSQVERLQVEKQSLTLKQAELAKLKDERRKIVNEWENLKAEKLRDLKDAAKAAGKALEGSVRVQVERGTTLVELEDVFRANIDGSGVKIAIDRLCEAEGLSLPALAEHIREGAHALVREYRFTEASAQKIAGGGDKLAMQVESVELEPEAVVELNIATGGKERWKRIEELSAGQRATAVLLLLLGGSTSPLVVDQPEDDLDNRFITGTIVETMRQEKRNRQFIFSTHNANIPVLGDAEQIVFLNPHVDGGEERTEVPEGCTGSIDNLEVRAVIGDVLEGGKEAFELRRAKYGY